MHVGAEVKPELLEVAAGARVHREDQRQLGGDVAQRAGDAVQVLFVVHVGGAVQGDHAIARELLLEGFGLEARPPRSVELVALVEQVVDHHVADVEDRRRVLALAQQVVDAGRLGAEEPVGDAVGDEAVDLLGHPHVATAQAGLDVGHRDVELLGVDGTGQRGVHVAHHQHAVGARLLADLLEGHHDLGGLGGVAAAAGVEVVVGLGDAQLVEEDVTHLPVVVLAGVDDLELEAVGTGLQRAHDGRDLHEVGARTGDEVNQGTGHARLHQLVVFASRLCSITASAK